MRVQSFFIIFISFIFTVFTGFAGGALSKTATYPSLRDGGYTIPAIPQNKISKQYRRQAVNYPSQEAAGSIIVDTKARHLYYILGKGKAVRYGVGIGRAGFRWTGIAHIGQMREWPVWTPPPAMIKRNPRLKQYAGGQRPGLKNPLGARALYLYKNGRDTLYRLHGTPEWWTIGTNASSGCIRLMNHDIIDLYSRAKVGSKVIVH